jgi:hypothetical protein
MARRLRLDPAHCGFKLDSGDAAAARSMFFVASVAAQ